MRVFRILADKLFWDVFLTTRFFLALGCCALLFILSFFYPPFQPLPDIVLPVFSLLVVIDYFFLFASRSTITAGRFMADRLSNGDENNIEIRLKSTYPFTVYMELIDELPVQFQQRDWLVSGQLGAGQQKSIMYKLRPTSRGEYHFGRVIIYLTSGLGLLKRRFNSENETMVPVYPSFMQMRKYELV